MEVRTGTSEDSPPAPPRLATGPVWLWCAGPEFGSQVAQLWDLLSVTGPQKVLRALSDLPSRPGIPLTRRPQRFQSPESKSLRPKLKQWNCSSGLVMTLASEQAPLTPDWSPALSRQEQAQGAIISLSAHGRVSGHKTHRAWPDVCPAPSPPWHW